MKANRDKLQGESLPDFEVVKLSGLQTKHQYRFAFEEVEREGVISFDYLYVNANSTNREEVIAAIIRSKYTADQVEAIVNNYLASKDILEYLKLQNWRKIAKAVADQDQAALDAAMQAQTYKISLPFNETLQGGTYADMADRMLKVKVVYESDPLTNVAIVYPGWVTQEDMDVLQADANVTIEQIDLYEEV